MQRWRKPENLALARTSRFSMTAAISGPPPSSRHQALRRGPAAARRGRGGGWSPWRGAGAGGLLGRAGGRADRWQDTGWAYAARGKGRLNFLYIRTISK